MSGFFTQLLRVGYAVLPGFLESGEVDLIAHRADDIDTGCAGTRHMLDVSWCSDLAERLMADARFREAGPEYPHPVQCTLFTKSPNRNWLVSLHQDLNIPVAERVAGGQFLGWSEKGGDVFVQPPVEVLQGLLAVRVHLDDCDERNGALRVVPGSHQLGRLTAGDASKTRETRGEVIVPVPRGGVMLMKPLLLHASSKSLVDSPRRVLHFVFGPETLPAPLRWPIRERSFPNDG